MRIQIRLIILYDFVQNDDVDDDCVDDNDDYGNDYNLTLNSAICSRVQQTIFVQFGAMTPKKANAKNIL